MTLFAYPCGCRIVGDDDRAATVYCKNHGRNNPPSPEERAPR